MSGEMMFIGFALGIVAGTVILRPLVEWWTLRKLAHNNPRVIGRLAKQTMIAKFQKKRPLPVRQTRIEEPVRELGRLTRGGEGRIYIEKVWK